MYILSIFSASAVVSLATNPEMNKPTRDSAGVLLPHAIPKTKKFGSESEKSLQKGH